MFDSIDPKSPFALIEKDGRLSLYQGTLHPLQKLMDIHHLAKREASDVVFVLPYHIIRERGFEARGDEPILGLAVTQQHHFRTADVLATMPNLPIHLDGEVTPDMDDARYAKMVAAFQTNEIARGNVSQTTLSRRFHGKLTRADLPVLLSIFRRIVMQSGHYMAVLFSNPADGQTILAATPERHLEVAGNQTIMTPIAGTLRKEDRETFPARLQNFVRDEKEINELFQVLDEEMKIMGVICPEGGAVDGPFLREVGAVVHTEYNLLGKRTLHSIDALRETLHAPTVVGSPIQSAARVIAKYEPHSRRYYAGEIGVYRCPRSDAPDGDIDSAILIRMAEIRADGSFHVQSGGGLVRDSVPMNEARESTAKAMGILRYFTNDAPTAPYLTPEILSDIRDPFMARNDQLSDFWMLSQNPHQHLQRPLHDVPITIINNEDDFAHMIGHVVKSFGAKVRVVDTHTYVTAQDDAQVVIIGPGPGDPNDLQNPRIARLHEIVRALKSSSRSLLGVCLGHQVLAIQEGLAVAQQTVATQGMPRRVTIDGTAYQLGFYNSFSPVSTAEMPGHLSVSLDDEGRIIHMTDNRADKRMVAFQFHPESVMSKGGRELMLSALTKLTAIKG